jgi:hypothetical protein
MKKTKNIVFYIIAFLLILLIITMSLLILFAKDGVRIRFDNGLFGSTKTQIATQNTVFSPQNQPINELQEIKNKFQNEAGELKVSLNLKIDELNQALSESKKDKEANKNLTDELNKLKEEITNKGKELETLNTNKSNLEAQKKQLENKNKELEKTISVANFNKTIKPKETIVVKQENELKVPKSNNVTKTVNVIYFWFRLEGTQTGALCSGMTQGNVILTVSHCQSNKPASDIVLSRSLLEEDIVPVYQETLTANFNDGKFKIFTVDKGVVNGFYNKYNYCQVGKCEFIYLDTEQLVGEGNSGSPLYDPAGNFVGVLSGGFNEVQCPSIKVGLLANNEGVRNCSTDISFAVDKSYKP